jgi:hypothetical protein
MQYAPAVTDRSAEIYAQGANNATNIRAQGQANFQNSLTSSFNTAMGMVSKRIEKNETDNAKMQQSMASGQAMMSLSDNYGEQGQKFKMSLGKALEDTKGNPDKMSGAVMAHAAEFENMQQIARMNAQVEGYKDLADYKSANTPAAANTQPKLDANYGRQFYQGLRQNGRTHEQALADMDNAGLNWAKPYIEGQKNPFFQ